MIFDYPFFDPIYTLKIFEKFQRVWTKIEIQVEISMEPKLFEQL